MDLVSEITDGRFVGLFGEPGVNVVKLNIAVEEEGTT
jgi:K+-transporting ATPase ATPase C chain